MDVIKAASMHFDSQFKIHDEALLLRSVDAALPVVPDPGWWLKVTGFFAVCGMLCLLKPDRLHHLHLLNFLLKPFFFRQCLHISNTTHWVFILLLMYWCFIALVVPAVFYLLFYQFCLSFSCEALCNLVKKTSAIKITYIIILLFRAMTARSSALWSWNYESEAFLNREPFKLFPFCVFTVEHTLNKREGMTVHVQLNCMTYNYWYSLKRPPKPTLYSHKRIHLQIENSTVIDTLSHLLEGCNGNDMKLFMFLYYLHPIWLHVTINFLTLQGSGYARFSNTME